MTYQSPWRWLRWFAMTMIIAMSPSLSVAGEMILTSADGTIQFRGEFLRFDGLNYVLEVNGNEVIVPALEVNCEGEDCLNFPPLPPVSPSNG